MSYAAFRISRPSARRKLTSIHHIQRLSMEIVTYEFWKKWKKAKKPVFPVLHEIENQLATYHIRHTQYEQRTPCIGDLSIDYLRFTIDYCNWLSPARNTHHAVRTTSNECRVSEIFLKKARLSTGRFVEWLTNLYIVFRMWYVVCCHWLFTIYYWLLFPRSPHEIACPLGGKTVISQD